MGAGVLMRWGLYPHVKSPQYSDKKNVSAQALPVTGERTNSMKKTLWMVLLMIAAIGVVGCSKTDEETAKDLEAAEEAKDAPKKVEAKDVAAVAKPMLDSLTKTVADNEAVAKAVDAVAAIDSRDKVMEDQLGLMASMVGVLEGVTDKATAEKAKPEMKSLNTKAEAVKLRADKLGEPTEEEEKGLKEKYGAQMEEVGGKIMAQMMRLMAKPEVMAIIQDSMSKGSDPKPETSKIEAPKIETPKIEAPIEAPKIEAPKVEIPELKMPG